MLVWTNQPTNMAKINHFNSSLYFYLQLVFLLKSTNPSKLLITLVLDTKELKSGISSFVSNIFNNCIRNKNHPGLEPVVRIFVGTKLNIMTFLCKPGPCDFHSVLWSLYIVFWYMRYLLFLFLYIFDNIYPTNFLRSLQMCLQSYIT